MSFDWESIEAEATDELGFYRLLGEMLQRTATERDLHRIREYLRTTEVGIDAWLSLGEALFHTSHGSTLGYRIWTEWARRAAGEDFDEPRHVAGWQRFRISSSDAYDAADTDAELDDEPPTIQIDYLLDDTDEVEDAPTRNLGAAHHSSVVSTDTARLISMIPCGPYTLRIFDEIWDGVDEFALIGLLRAGVLLGGEILYGGRWVAVVDYPGFDPLVDRLRRDTFHVLADAEPVEMEATESGPR
jgi:hypothetical protein